MNSLIQIQETQINNEVIKSVNARDLHSFLGSRQEFAHWIKDRINQYGFNQGQDFLIKLSKTPNGGRPSKEYHISIDMAKELSMVEKNEKGKQARQYFIDCEKKAKQALNITALPSTKELALMVVKAEEEKELLALENKELESKVEEMQPEVDALHRIATVHDSVCITEAAKILQVRPIYLTDLMSENKWIYHRTGGKSWLGYQDKIHSGYIEHKLTTIYRQDGSEKVCTQVRLKPKGITQLASMIEKINYQKQLMELRA